MPNYLDLFAGAGGLSEGFLQAGFDPVAHIEMDEAACYTLKTRCAYKWLERQGQGQIYGEYLRNHISRDTFYRKIPPEILNTVLHCEISQDTIEGLVHQVEDLLGNEQLDLIVGGPPCQAYSVIGRARSENRMIGDQRNYLYRMYAQFLLRLQPQYFVFENVLGLLSAKDEDGELHFDNMRQLFRQCGYSVEYQILNARDYGVLQNRKRIILIGKHGLHNNFYPDIPEIHSNCYVEEIFRDLPEIHAGEGVPTMVDTKLLHSDYLIESGIKRHDGGPVTLHYARPHTVQDLEIYRRVVRAWNDQHSRLRYDELPDQLRTHRNRNSFLDRFKVVAANLPYSQTVTAHISKDGHYYIHPSIDQNRSITPREAARLQTFPDDYYFESVSGIPSRTAAFKQIGNAVPVRLALSVATALLNEMEDIN